MAEVRKISTACFSFSASHTLVSAKCCVMMSFIPARTTEWSSTNKKLGISEVFNHPNFIKTFIKFLSNFPSKEMHV
jgi:hypothetical protein